MSADRSNVPAGETARDMLEHFRPELLIVCGVAGGIAGRDTALGPISPGHVVVADTLHYTAFRKFTSTGDVRRHFAHDPPSMGLVNRHARALARDIDMGNTIGHPFAGEPVPAGHAWPPRIHVGPMIVGESVMGNPHHPEQRLAAGLIDNALAVDMESIGVARAVHRMREAVDYNPRLLVVRGVSRHGRGRGLRGRGQGPAGRSRQQRPTPGVEAVRLGRRRIGGRQNHRALPHGSRPAR